MSDEKHIEWIGSYLRGDLSAEEIVKFESELAANPKLQKELELQKEIHDALSNGDIDEFKKKAKEAETRYESRKKKVTRLLGSLRFNWAA